jgi:phosphodiesterase/alkaline phosphatase D-like protein
VSPSVVLPKSSSGGADDWGGFSESLPDLLTYIAQEKLRVVFLCGDSHLAMATRIRMPGRPQGDCHCLCIASTPLYAPMPFANARRSDAPDADSVALNDGSKLSYVRDADSIVASDGVTVVGAELRGADWWVTVDVYVRSGRKPRRNEYKLD